MSGFTCSAQLMGITLKVDRSASLRFTTGELASEEKVEISNHQLNSGWLLFSENPIQEEEIPKELADTGQKTSSQRLRAVIYLLWKQRGSEGDFSHFYASQMEHLIDIYKQKLED